MIILHSIGPNVVGTFGARVIMPKGEISSELYDEIGGILRDKIQYEIDSNYGDGPIVVPNLRSYMERCDDDYRDTVVFTAKVHLGFLEAYSNKED